MTAKNTELDWKKPDVKDLGNAQQVIKDQDVDGSGDNFAPINLASL